MERAESASEDNLSTATLNEARAELIVILKALGSPTNSSSVEKYFRRGPKPRGDSRTADSLKDKFGELQMPMDKKYPARVLRSCFVGECFADSHY